MKITSKQIKQLIEQQLAAVLEQDLPQVAGNVPVQGTKGRTDRPRFEGEEFMTPLEVDQAIRGRIPELDNVSVDFANPPPEHTTDDPQGRLESEPHAPRMYSGADPAEEELYFSQPLNTRNPEDIRLHKAARDAAYGKGNKK